MICRILLALTVAFLLSGCARTAAKFGFGPPPTVSELRSAVNEYLTKDLYRPGSVQSLLISRPETGCMFRGPGKRNVCGYKACLYYNAQNQSGNYVGTKRYDFWITNGWGYHQMPATGECTKDFMDWTGEPAIAVRSFCETQPDHPGCASGKTEQYSKPNATKNTVVATSQVEYAQAQAARWAPASEKDLASLSEGADLYLKDGASARYRDVVVTPERVLGATKYCGLINAKNSWGAYGGYTRFVYVSPAFFAMEDRYNGRFITESCK